MKSKVSNYLSILLVGLLVMSACSESVDTDQVQPKLPPVASLEVDYNDLPSQAKIKDQNSDSAIVVAYVSAVAIGAVLEANLALPKAILKSAENSRPTYKGDGLWEWEYGANGPNGSFGVRLTAQVNLGDTEDVDWNFYVSAQNSSVDWDNVLLFSGNSTLDGEDGRWDIYNPESGDLVTTTNWTVDDENTSVTLNIFDPESNEEQYRINYSFVAQTKTLSVENFKDDENTVIQWDVETKIGFIISSGFNNGNKACWDANFEDVSCSG